MTTPTQAARHLIEQLPEETSWDDIRYGLYVKQKIESGRTIPYEQDKIALLGNGH